MSLSQWYELRVAGSPGTKTGNSANEGIAISQSGRLCIVSSGHAMRFETEQDAFDFLIRQTTPGRYRFEVVHCNAAAPSARPLAASAYP